jgi:hypothetical protein
MPDDKTAKIRASKRTAVSSLEKWRGQEITASILLAGATHVRDDDGFPTPFSDARQIQSRAE